MADIPLQVAKLIFNVCSLFFMVSVINKLSNLYLYGSNDGCYTHFIMCWIITMLKNRTPYDVEVDAQVSKKYQRL